VGVDPFPLSGERPVNVAHRELTVKQGLSNVEMMNFTASKILGVSFSGAEERI